ncbi:MAG: T9SS type A sorting domain-containing protein [Chitinophagales bacterium]
MRKFAFIIFLFASAFGYAQSLPIDFESAITTADFINFDGGTATVIANPQSSGNNTSGKVAQIVRNGGQVWGGSKLIMANNLDFSTAGIISMKVYTAAPAGTIVKIKLENGTGSAEADVPTTVSNQWETMSWNFSGQPSVYNNLVFMFDFGNVGNGSASSTFLFDDIQQVYTGAQIDLPVDFEGTSTNYSTTDFGGNVSSLVVDPTNAGNMVIKVIKTAGAATWAGTTIGTPSGFATNIPFTLTNSKMTVRVWSPAAGTPIRLKVEDSNDPTHTCETELNTTLTANWESLVFDFINQAPGTELLSVGLSMGWHYNMASLFFNFGTDGATAGEKTYYFDDVAFGEVVLGINDPAVEVLNAYPNPSNSQWTITSKEKISTIEIFDAVGKQVYNLNPDSREVTVDASAFAAGIYLSRMTTTSGSVNIKLIKK